MGMFDSLYVKCRKCRENVEFQSKAGDCSMNSYSLTTIPANVAGDLIGESQACKCGNVISLRGAVMLIDDQSC